MRRFIGFIILFIILAIVEHSSGQQIDGVYTKKKEDGLSDYNVKHTIRDHKGYFYFFSYNGIQRYDGKSFIDIELQDLAIDNLIPEDITEVGRTDEGYIILSVKKSNQSYFLDVKDKAIRRLPFKGYPIVDHGQLYFTKVEGRMWSLFSYNFTSSDVPVNITNLDFEPTEMIRSEENTYIADEGLKIYRLFSNGVDEMGISGRLERNGEYCYVINDDGVHQLMNGKHKQIFQNPTDAPLRYVNHDQKGNILFAFSEKSLFRRDVYVMDTTQTVSDFSTVRDVNDKFRDVYADDYFYKWMLVSFVGVQVISFEREGSSGIDIRPGVRDGDYGRLITAICKDTAGDILYFRESSGITKYYPQRGDIERMFQEQRKDYFTNNTEYALHGPSNTILGSTYTFGDSSHILRFYPDSRSIIERNKIDMEVKDLIVVNRDSLLLFGNIGQDTNHGMVAGYNFNTNTLTPLLKDSIDEVRGGIIDGNHIWAGTVSGTYVFDSEFNILTKYHKLGGKYRRINNDYTNVIGRYGDHMVLGTYGSGFYFVDRNSFDIEYHLSTAQGITDDNATAIITDRAGNCWLSTFDGLNVIDSNLNIVNYFYSHDGLINREFNTKVAEMDDYGNLYFGTINGVQKVNPQKMIKWEKSFIPYIESIEVFEKDFVKTINEFDESIEIYDSIDSLIFNFQTPDYYNVIYENRNVFINLNDEQVFRNGREKSLVLNEIVEGNYKVSINAINKSPDETFSVNTLKDRRLLYRILFITLAFGIISYAIIRLALSYNKRIERNKTELNKRISNLRLSALQSQMNPHFIFNSLGAIQYFIQTHDTEKADEYLSSFAMLMRKILEASKSKLVRVREEIALLELYLKLESVRFEGKFDYELIVDDDIDEDALIPPMLVQPFIENSINHGLYNLTDRKGSLTVQYDVRGNDLICIVEDNGIGRKAAAKLRNKNHKSRGMQLITERLETLNSFTDINVKKKTEDLYNKREPLGTKVTIVYDDYENIDEDDIDV